MTITVGDFRYPCDLNIEAALIASIIMDNNCAVEVARIVKPDNFYHLPHSIIFGEIMLLTKENKPFDIAILKDRLLNSGMLDKVGGIEKLITILESAPTPSHAVYYAEIVLEKYLLRMAIVNAHNIISAVDKGDNIDSIRNLYKTGLDMLDGHGEIENQRKIKMAIERDFIKHLIFADGHHDVRNIMSVIVNKLTPAHFSDLTCQCIYRVILLRFNKGEHFALPYLVDYDRKDLGLGFIGASGLAEFLGAETVPDFSVTRLTDYAAKIIQAYDYIAKLMVRR